MRHCDLKLVASQARAGGGRTLALNVRVGERSAVASAVPALSAAAPDTVQSSLVLVATNSVSLAR